MSGLAAGKRGSPAQRVTAYLLEHPRPDLHDDPGLLRERYEVERRDQPALRMHPAQERFDTDGAVRDQRDLGLILDIELALLERHAQ